MSTTRYCQICYQNKCGWFLTYRNCSCIVCNICSLKTVLCAIQETYMVEANLIDVKCIVCEHHNLTWGPSAFEVLQRINWNRHRLALALRVESILFYFRYKKMSEYLIRKKDEPTLAFLKDTHATLNLIAAVGV